MCCLPGLTKFQQVGTELNGTNGNDLNLKELTLVNSG